MIDAQEFFQWFIENANYWFVFLFMMVESSFVPFPSEVVVPPAVFLACANIGVGAGMNPYMVILIATLGALCGALINYYLAYWVGRPIVYKFADSRFGHACLIDRAKVKKAEAYFDKHGAISTFIGRLIPAVRQLISIPAGLAKMKIIPFCIYTFLGAGVWNCILGLLGYWLSTQVTQQELFNAVEKYNGYLTWIGLGILLLCIAYIAFNAMRHKKENV